jgi:starch phosphorylase
MNAPAANIEPLPRKVDPETLKAEIIDKLAYSVGKDPIVAKSHDWLAAAILVVRDRAIDRWMESTRAAYTTGAKPPAARRDVEPRPDGADGGGAGRARRRS